MFSEDFKRGLLAGEIAGLVDNICEKMGLPHPPDSLIYEIVQSTVTKLGYEFTDAEKEEFPSLFDELTDRVEKALEDMRR